MSSKMLLVPLGLAALGLGACETVHPVSQSIDPAFSETIKYNAAIQTVNPDPLYPAGGAQPGSDAAKATAAVKRYRTDQVKEVERTATTSGSSGGPQ